MRKRVSVKSSLVGSSDIRRIHAAKACREFNHSCFMAKGSHYRTVEVTGEAKFDVPVEDDKFITVRVKGKNVKFTFEEHRILKAMGFIK
jgi:uncharacterized protein (UPF0179 family)